MDNSNKNVSVKDFEEAFNTQLSQNIASKIEGYDFIYTDISAEERDACLIKIVQTLLDKSLPFSGEHRREQWESGWGENLSLLNNKPLDEAVAPKYFGKYDVVRWKQKFVKAISPDFEKNMLGVILDWLFEKYLPGVEAIYEFGCGTGHNLLRARQVNNVAKICGLDWAESSQKIIKKIATDSSDGNLFAHKFDFFNPDQGFNLDHNSVVYTVAALEQVGDRYIDFINYLLQNKPKICFHVEPIAELLDENNLLDFLSIAYFKKRNYLSGFMDHLKDLEQRGQISIIQSQRSHIGSFYIDGYSIVAWSPKP